MSKDPHREELIAPCGMNCRICVAYFGYAMNGNKRKHRCVGCREQKKECGHLKKHCTILAKNQLTYCFSCKDFPCKQLQYLDEKYQQRFNMSTIENLKLIKKKGIHTLLKSEEEKWKCPQCEEVLCCHTGICYACGYTIENYMKEK